MLKRLYLITSLVFLVFMAIGASSAIASQKEKQKEKSELKDKELLKEKQWAAQDGAAKKAFALPQFVGEGGYLGVYLEEVTPDRVKELGLSEERGAIVMKVVAGSPAEKAGLKENDVIVSFNGNRVDSVRGMQRLLSETPPDRNVSLEVMRGGARQSIAAMLSKKTQNFAFATPDLNGQWQFGEESRKRTDEDRKRLEELLRRNQEGFKNNPDFGNFSFVNPGEFALLRGRRLGVGVESLTPQLADYFGVKEGRGLLITQVGEGSPGSKAGLKAGDVIIAIDNEQIDGVNALLSALSKKEEGVVAIKIIRNRAEQTVNVTLEKRAQPPVSRPRASLAARILTLA
jgi:serine protease Do